MSDFDIMNEINKILDMNSMTDYVIVGAFLGVFGYVVFQMSRSLIPGIAGLVFPALGGSILGAMLYIFTSGTAGG